MSKNQSETQKAFEIWKKEKYDSQPERNASFSTIGGIEVPPVLTSAHQKEFSEERNLGFPGVFPFTRGPQPTMYRGRLWTMRQFAGFGTPEDTNKRFRYLLENGQTGLSTAFDMPTLMGYDPDHALSEGEVGREGVSVACISDMEALFSGIDLKSVTTSMTVNCTAAPILAMYFAVAKRQGHNLNDIGGTIQNDILKEYIAQKEWICPVTPGVKLACDLIEFSAKHAKKFNPISISGYHIREAGATAVQELAFTIYDGITYVEHCLSRGLSVDEFAPRLSFFWDIHNDFFEEIAKLRASRRMWAHIMRDRFGAKNERSLMLRTHCQTAGVSLTAQQPINNVARVAIQALAAVLGGTQSLHTNALDETLSLPTEEAAKVALRTQQIIAEETGVTNTIDPLAGSYFVEHMTDLMEAKAIEYIDKLDAMGGMIRAIEQGYPQKEIAESAFVFQRELERGERKIVGVNAYQDSSGQIEVPLHEVAKDLESKQRARFIEFKKSRSNDTVSRMLSELSKACAKNENVMPVMIEAVSHGVTVGEVSEVYRKVYGVYTDPGLM